MFVFQTLNLLLFLLWSGHDLHAWTLPGVYNVGPVLGLGGGQLVPPLDDEDTGVADVSPPLLLHLETALETRSIALTCCKAGAEEKREKINISYNLILSANLLDFARQMQQPFWDLNIFGLNVVIVTHSPGVSENN